jgi:hypothetical protein
MRNGSAVPAVLAIPAVSIEKHEVREFTAFAFLANPKKPLHRGAGSAFASRVEFFNTKSRWSCRSACNDAALTISTFDRGRFRHARLGFGRWSFGAPSLLQFCHFSFRRPPGAEVVSVYLRVSQT